MVYRRNVIRLHHRDKAGRPLRVRWALEEAGAAYDFAVMTQEEGEGDEHKRRHPLGRVPVLETEDGFLFESAALCLQVADLYPDANLIPPPGTYERGLVYQWTVWAMSELEPAIIRAYMAQQADDADRAKSTQERLTKLFAALEQALDGHDFVTGDDFTIADVVVGGVLVAAQRRELMPDSPNVNAYLERLNARPAKQRAYDLG
jgi:glutathione S-transferase